MADYLRESGVKWLWERIKTLLSAKQDKLVSGTNIKTINGTSLLGSGDVVVSGDSTGDVDEGRLVWSEEAVSQGTIIDGIMYNAHQNGLAFMNPSCIDVYYSIDNGDTWQDYGLTTTQKLYLVTPVTGNYSLYLGKDSTNKSVNYRLRVDLRIKDADIQFTGKKLYLKWLSNTPSDAYYIDISVLKYENYESNEWTHVGTFHKKNTLTIPLNEVMGYNGARGILSLRIEAYRTGTTEPRYNSALTNIAFLYTTYTKGNNFGKTGLPMTIDTSQNSIFPAYIKARKFIPNGGKSTQVLKGDGSLEEESALAVASAIDAEHAEEADYAGVADKLTNPRTISLSGGAVGTATAFDGSKNINIPVTKIDEGILAWSDKDSPSTLMDIAYLNGNGNKIAGIPPSLVTIEYSADNGATWVDSGISDANKTRLTNHRINGNTNLRPNGSTTLDINYQTRITIDLIEDNATNAWVGCFEFRKIILKCSGIQRNDTHTLTIEMQKYGSTTWDIIKTSRFWGSPGFFSIPTPKRTVGYPSSSYYRKVRLTWQTGDVYTNVASINGVYFMSDNIIGVGGGKEPSQYAITGTPYSIDYNQNTIFPNAIKGKKLITDGGKSNQVVLGDGSLRPISELSPITDADAEILLDNHIHSIDVNANGNNVNISVIESSKIGNNWETEDNNITIPLATPTSAGVMSKEDKAKLDDLSVIEIKYTLTEHEYNNHEIVNLYNIVYAISNRLYNNGWLYNDDKSYDVVVKGWVDNRYNAITYANFNVRLLTTQDGHSLGINGYVDVAQITETNENADCPLWVGYICGKYHIEDDGMAFYAPENPNFIVEA